MRKLNYVLDSEIFEFRENLTIGNVNHDFLFYGIYNSHNVLNNVVTEYIEITKISDVIKYLEGDETVSEIVRYESNIPKDLVSLINLIRYNEGKNLINS